MTTPDQRPEVDASDSHSSSGEVRVSVVIPCFNDGKTLPEAVASVLGQERCEIVVVDDGSDDAQTARVIEELRERGIKVLRQDNQGPSAARVAGLAVTTGRYVFPLDADDVLAPGALTVLADALDANPSAVAAWGDVEYFGDTSVYARGPARLDPWLLTYVNGFTGAMLLRRDRLSEVGGWYLKEGYETWDLLLSFAERAWTGIYVSGLVLRYRKHGDRRSTIGEQSFVQLQGQLRERHPSLFAERRALRRQSQARWRLKVALPLIDALPLTPFLQHRLQNLANHPSGFFQVRRDRLSRRIAAFGRRERRTRLPTMAPTERLDPKTAALEPVAPPSSTPSQVTTTAMTYGANVGVATLSLASALIVARALGPSGRGSVALLTTIAVLTHYGATLGIQEANVNLASADSSVRRTLATNSILLAAIFGGSAALVVGSISTVFPDLAGDSRPALVRLALASVPIQLGFTYLSRLVQADYRFGVSNAAWIAAPLVIVVGNGLLDALGLLTVGSALGAWVAGQVVATSIMVVAVARSPGFGPPRRALAKQAVRFGLKTHPATVMNFTNYRLDQWLLGVLATKRELGLYSVAVSWSEALFFLPTAISYAQRPHLVRGSASDAAKTASFGFRAASAMTIPLVVGMIVAAPFLCTIIFGAGFEGSVINLRILTLGAFGILAVKVLGNALTARGRPLLTAAAVAVAFTSTVVLDVLLIPNYGAVGASIASAAAYSAGGIAVVVLFLRTTGAHPNDLIPRLGEGRSLPQLLHKLRGGTRMPGKEAED